MSSLSLDTILRRTIEYFRKDIYVLWLLQWTPELDVPRYTPRLWEKWIHAAYFGHVYYWTEGLLVDSYWFEPALKSVPKASWLSNKGKRMTGGGYTKRLTRYRTGVREATFNLTTDFIPRERYWWEGGGAQSAGCEIVYAPRESWTRNAPLNRDWGVSVQPFHLAYCRMSNLENFGLDFFLVCPLREMHSQIQRGFLVNGLDAD